MPRVCTVCVHPELAEINKALLLRGGSKSECSVRYGLSTAAIQRHRSGCLGHKPRQKQLGPSSEGSEDGGSVRFDNIADEITGPKDLLKRLQRLFRLGDLLEEAYQRRDVDATVKLAREYRAAAESYAKVAGWLVEGGGNTTLIDARRQQVALFGELSIEELRAIAAGQQIPIASKPALELSE